MTDAPATPALRVTPLTVLPEIGPTLRRYLALGFEPVATDDPGCVGLRAGTTAVILASAAFMAGDFAAAHVSSLAGRTITYVHVASVDEVTARLPTTTRIVQDVRTRGGTREVLVEDSGDHLILAETTTEAG